MEESNKKFITLSFVGTAAAAAYVMSVLIDTLARSVGAVARYINNDMVIHGLPIGVAIVTFVVLQFNPKIVKWADEVIVEVRKVVWPSNKDTFAMTIVVTVMLLISGVLLWTFDFITNTVVNFVIEM